MSQVKLKASQVAQVRAEILASQDGLCAVCHKEPVAPSLDHRHGKYGYIRGVLCRGCNSLEGRISNNAPRSQVTDLPAYLRGLADYLEKHATDQTGLLHPSHRSAEEKKVLAKKRASKKLLNR